MNTLIAFSLRHRVLMLVGFMAVLAGGLARISPAQHRGLSRSDAADGGRHHPERGAVGRRGRALHHDPDRGAACGHPQHAHHPHDLAVRLSDVKLQFSFDFSYDEALQQVLNRLSQLPPLPNGALPQISPVSPDGEIYRYKLAGPPNYSLVDLKTLQDCFSSAASVRCPASST